MSTETIKVPIHDNEGIAKVLAQIVELYKVCENKELVDRVLESYITPAVIITSNGKAMTERFDIKV